MTQTPETVLASQWVSNPVLACNAFWRRRVAQLLAEHGSSRDPSARAQVVSALARRLEDNTARDAYRILHGLGLYRDLVDMALERIDWSVVAEALLDRASQPEGWKAVEAVLAATKMSKSHSRGRAPFSRHQGPIAHHRTTPHGRRERPKS